MQPTAFEMRDPRTAYPRPPFSQQQAMKMPGSEAEMRPQADHGEKSYQGSDKLKGSTAIITGADSGIGRAVALCYAREGANVVLNYLSEDEDARQTEALVREADAETLLVKGDLREEACCQRLIRDAHQHFGQLDILVCNAAYQEVRDEIEEMSTELFDRIFKTNVYATFWLAREAMSKISPGGSIINTVSIQGFDPSPGLLPYSTSKSALIGMTVSWRPNGTTDWRLKRYQLISSPRFSSDGRLSFLKAHLREPHGESTGDGQVLCNQQLTRRWLLSAADR